MKVNLNPFSARVVKKWWSALLAACVVGGVYVGCAEQKFERANTEGCTADETCEIVQNKESYEYDIEVGYPQVDILFVDDNSASMSPEQKKIAEKFSNFIATLKNSNVDYRIAITTTDISSAKNPARTINKNGALQDGKLIQFSNGEYFLTGGSGSLAQQVAMFNEQIQRPETLQCDQFITNWNSASGLDYTAEYAKNCPSQDERGIYAVNNVVSENPHSFLRPKVNFALIIVSDEDLRSQLYYYNYEEYKLASLDEPETLISNLKSKFPNKAMTTYPIIVTTESCKAQQDQQVNGVKSSYGLKYYDLARLTGGMVGDICAANYTNQLGVISANIIDKVSQVELHCGNPLELEVTMTGSSIDVEYTLEGKNLKFEKSLPPGSKIHIKYQCT